MNSEPATKSANTPLVALGASAGGLEPLEAFFNAAPADAGWCFVVIQHLSPDYRSMMKAILERKSHLRIQHVADGLSIEPDTIYLNKPSEFVRLEDGVFRTQAFDGADELPHLPIDYFINSICDRPPSKTAAVILSGSGSDGARGAAMLRSSGGAVFVQTPSEADFTSMPQAVLKSGAVNRILSARLMPQAISEYFATGAVESETPAIDPDKMSEEIQDLLKKHANLDFSAYKTDLVQRRISRRQELHGFRSIEEYRQLLLANPAALDELYQDLLIGVTEFYRNPEAIAALRTNVLDELVKTKTDDEPIRIWVPACASGEEAYTIAIELSEAIRASGSDIRFRIIATDVHKRSIDRASTGLYTAESLTKMDPELRDRYFMKHRDQYVVEPTLRQKLIFSVHDALTDPPFMHLDLISCRNLLIYLNTEPRTRIISMFMFGLRRDGFLFLGPSETLGSYSDEFATINGRWRIFQKTSQRQGLDRFMLTDRQRTPTRHELPSIPNPSPVRSNPYAATDNNEPRNRDLLIRSYNALLKRYAPSSILISADGRVLNWFGAASAFVDTLNNLAEWTIEDIVHPSLHFAINVGMEKLRRNTLENYHRKVKVDFEGEAVKWCNLTIEPLENHDNPRFLLISIRLDEDTAALSEDHVPTAGGGDDATILSHRITELERDLRLTEETLQQVTERLEASGEELQASNEELQASNEELQASNEELQSSNEELHAVNEELVTVSAEHELKIEELSDLNANMDLVLNLLKVGVIFLDQKGRIRRFSQFISDKFHLQSHDIDRSLDVVGPRFDFANLKRMTDATLATGAIQSATGDHDDMTLSIESHPIPLQNDATVQNGVVLIIKGFS